jgi:large subunit ribosomal protein L29
MKTREVKELTAAEIRERLETARTDLNRMKLQHAVSPVENTSLMTKTRRDIARMLTILSQKES